MTETRTRPYLVWVCEIWDWVNQCHECLAVLERIGDGKSLNSMWYRCKCSSWRFTLTDMQWKQHPPKRNWRKEDEAASS